MARREKISGRVDEKYNAWKLNLYMTRRKEYIEEFRYNQKNE